MKKILVCLLVLLIAFPCSQAFAASQKEYDEVVQQRDALYQQIIDAGLKPVVELKKESLATELPVQDNADYAVVKEYKWSDSWYSYYGIVLKNTSGKDSEIEVSVYFKDKNGDIIGVQSQDEYACENGFETFWLFSNEDKFDSVEYEITMSEDKYYESIQSELDLKVSTTKGKAILSAKNTGDRIMEYVEYNVLFLDKKGNVVGNGWGFLADKDSEIKPGKTVMAEETCRETFAEVVLYANGRAN